MPKFIVLMNQPCESSETVAEATALAKQLAEKNPGVSYDVYQFVDQLFADEPVRPSVTAKTVSEREAETLAAAVKTTVITK